MATGYESAKGDKSLMRRALEGAVNGTKSIFGVSDEAKAEEKESKLIDTWTKEIQLAKKFQEKFQTDGVDAVKAYLDEQDTLLSTNVQFRLNLFHANIETLTSIMYAKLPKVEADRRFADPNDDEARVASEIITRILSNDMNDPEDKLNLVLKQALQDRLVPGMGSGRVRYCMEEKEAPEEGVEYTEESPAPMQKSDEWCDIEYVHWRDLLWSPCRTPAELRWKAFRVYLTKPEVMARFGEDIAKICPYASRGPKLDPSGDVSFSTSDVSQHQDASQAEIWEIWDGASKRVYWYVEGCSRFLDIKDDPMELDGFYPDAPPMMANLSTLKYLPKADYMLSKDLYDEINELELRIALLTRACKVVGVYPAAATEIKRILTEGCENELVGVENWAMFADKGGLKGQVEYFPIREVAETLVILVQQQAARIQQLYQVTGMSDIIRGQATTSGVTATEQKIKAQFASTRMQSFQDEFAQFASELLNRKVQLIRKYYDPERIKRLSNILKTPDAALADVAIALIKDETAFDCRVTVKAESMSQIDYDALKSERSEFMQSVAGFLSSAGPLLKEIPQAAPFLLELLKFNLAGMKGSNAMEGVVDQAVAALLKAEQDKAAQPPEPTPEEKVEQIKVQGQIQVAQAKGQADAAAKQQEAQTSMQIAQAEFGLERERMQMEMQHAQEEHQLKIRELEMKLLLMQQKMQFDRESQQLEIKGDQVELQLEAEGQQMEMAHDEQKMELESEHAERDFEREEDHSERQFDQQERHAEQAAKREAKAPKGDE